MGKPIQFAHSLRLVVLGGLDQIEGLLLVGQKHPKLIEQMTGERVLKMAKAAEKHNDPHAEKLLHGANILINSFKTNKLAHMKKSYQEVEKLFWLLDYPAAEKS